MRIDTQCCSTHLEVVEVEVELWVDRGVGREVEPEREVVEPAESKREHDLLESATSEVSCEGRVAR